MHQLVTTYEIVWLEDHTSDAAEDQSLATLAGIAADPSTLSYDELLAVALAADETAAAWLLEDVQAA